MTDDMIRFDNGALTHPKSVTLLEPPPLMVPVGCVRWGKRRSTQKEILEFLRGHDSSRIYVAVQRGEDRSRLSFPEEMAISSMRACIGVMREKGLTSTYSAKIEINLIRTRHGR